ncbi:VapE domain-containing protein [Flavobacterium xanthum]|uniref:Virulence-associated protein E n=1 Tax=Flavobacterium xanthum TaxID=69322 RepID=A0A1M7I4V2_9FLAO|nr:VapE domain-containing protein [Flavobacterium xanthum]SHM35784.1 Virulence-associated protein E [Flavobacterium xanthum]
MSSTDTIHRLESFETAKSFKDKLIFSYYKSAKCTEKTKDIYLSDHLNLISDPKNEALSALPADEYKKRKVHQPCITGSCIMRPTGRSLKDIQELNGLAVVDIDILPIDYDNWHHLKDVLAKDKYTFLIHFSLSGNGLCIFVKIPTENNFNEIYLSFQQYYKKEYDVNIDFLADPTRLRFISYDPKYILNENSQVYTDVIKEVATAALGEQTDNFLLSNDPATVFNNNPKSIVIINELLEQQGYTVTDGKGKTMYEYQRADGSPKSIVCYNNEAVIKFHVFSPNTGLLKLEYNLYDLYKELAGMTDYEAQKKLSLKGFGTFTDPIKVVSKSKESYTELLEYSSLKNIRLNQLTGVAEIDEQPLTDFHISDMVVESSLLFNKDTQKDKLLSVIDVLANNRKFHPFLEYVEKLKTLEPTEKNQFDELDKFLDCFTSKTPKPLMRIYFIRWMLGLFDLHLLQRMTKNVLVVTGEQGAAKTSLSKNILPNDLKNYGKVTEFNLSKLTDSKIALCSILVGCYDEFENILTKSTSLANFKNLTASYDIFERRPYRRNHEQMFRSAIIMATSNHTDIFTDPTGNTRFLAFNVQSFNLEKYFKINIDKVWQLIYELHKAGETSNLTESERILQATENSEFEAIDPYTEMILQSFEKCEKSFTTATEITQEMERHTRQRISINKVGAALKKLGFEKINKRVNGVSKRGYGLKYLLFDLE